jgi:hypothetical protein
MIFSRHQGYYNLSQDYYSYSQYSYGACVFQFIISAIHWEYLKLSYQLAFM